MKAGFAQLPLSLQRKVSVFLSIPMDQLQAFKVAWLKRQHAAMLGCQKRRTTFPRAALMSGTLCFGAAPTKPRHPPAAAALHGLALLPCRHWHWCPAFPQRCAAAGTLLSDELPAQQEEEGKQKQKCHCLSLSPFPTKTPTSSQTLRGELWWAECLSWVTAVSYSCPLLLPRFCSATPHGSKGNTRWGSATGTTGK